MLRQLYPKVHAAFRFGVLQPVSPSELIQPPAHPVPLAFADAPEIRKPLLEYSLLHVLEHDHLGRPVRVGDAQGHHVRKLLDDLPVRRHKGHADAGHHVQREGVHVDDIVPVIHGFDRRQRPFAVVDLRALIVFDDRNPVLVGQFEDLTAPLQAQHCSFWVVEAGVYIDELGLTGLDDFVQVIRDHTVLVRRNREQLSACQFDGPVDVGSHDLIDDDPVSRRKHKLQNEIQRLVVL